MTDEAFAFDVIRILRTHGHASFLVGGCVRDRLLGTIPKDYDVSTNARPPQVLSLFKNSRLVGHHFGVVLVPNPDPAGTHVEVATFRSEGAYSDGRHPDHVRFEDTPQRDVERRDFTINGLLEDPLANHGAGEIVDFVGGRYDLEARLIRSIGNPVERFREDHLRLLRAVRLAARLDFGIEAGTAAAIRFCSADIQRTAAERVRDELNRILTGDGAQRGLDILNETGLLAEVLPEVKALEGVEQPPQFHPEGDVYIHTSMMLGCLRRPSITLAWGALMHDIGKPGTFRVADRIRFDGHVDLGVKIASEILRRLRFSNEDAQQILSLVSNHMRFKDVRAMRESTLRRFLRLPHFDEHLELHRVDCLSSNGNLENYNFMKTKFESLGEEELRPPRLISGRDLIAMGFQPGPTFSDLLEQVESAQMEGTITTHEEALAFALERLAR
jgi:putative nucleotidyltransferase with HDIG domain